VNEHFCDEYVEHRLHVGSESHALSTPPTTNMLTRLRRKISIHLWAYSWPGGTTQQALQAMQALKAGWNADLCS
jgi:hypothetical protein